VVVMNQGKVDSMEAGNGLSDKAVELLSGILGESMG